MGGEQSAANEHLDEFVRLLTEHDRGILLFILSLVPNWADAEEIQQETNVKLWQGFGTFQLGSDFGAWARTIAWYEVMTFRERKQREWLRTSQRFLELVAAEAESVVDEGATSQTMLAECVEELSAFSRELVRLHYTLGRKIRDIARELVSTPEALYKALQRARVELRQCMDRKLGEGGAGMTTQPIQDDTLFNAVHDLVTACLEGVATAATVKLLDELVSDDRNARVLYLRYLRDSIGLRYVVLPSEGEKIETVASAVNRDADISVIRPISSSPQMSSPVFPFLSTALHGTIGYFSEGMPLAYLLATVVTGLGLLMGSLIHVSGFEKVAHTSAPSGVAAPRTEFVGRITGMVDCKWAGIGADASGVPLGRKYELASGLMEITYDSGAKIILQGPVTYEVESAAGGYLSLGRLTARVEKKLEGSSPESRIPNSALFSVRTPCATVTDLGTEFGIEVDKQGYTTSHVFRGSVRVQVIDADGKIPAASRVLHEKESASVGNHGGHRIKILDPSAQLASFVRELPQRTIRVLDLVDVVAGGDGFSGHRDRGIDPSSGRATNIPPAADKLFISGDGKYHRVTELPMVDGVFIPVGGEQPEQVDSAGHTFAGWVNATSNRTYGFIWAGGRVPALPLLCTTLGNVDYAMPGHGLIFLHANSGITFDLAAIRRANPGHKVMRFLAMTGNTESDSAQVGIADVWVFVDGHSRFRRCEINGGSGVYSVVVPIAENDRFLTLASTDGGNGIGWDWIVFGDPRLELTPVPAYTEPLHSNRGSPDNESQTK